MTASEVPDETRAAVARVRRAMRPRIWFVGAVILLCAVDDWLHPWTLVNQVPWTVKGPSIFAGLLFGAWISATMVRIQDASGTAPGWRSYLAIFLMPFFMAPIGSYIGRRGYEIASFWGVEAKSAGTIEAIVADKGTRQRQSVLLKLESGQREFWADTGEVIDRTWIGLRCVRFQASGGRNGAVRVFVPTLPLDRFVPCTVEARSRYPDLEERVARIQQLEEEDIQQ